MAPLVLANPICNFLQGVEPEPRIVEGLFLFTDDAEQPGTPADASKALRIVVGLGLR